MIKLLSAALFIGLLLVCVTCQRSYTKALLRGLRACPTHDLPLPSQISTKDCQVYIPPLKTVRVIKVYDGDTITIATRMTHLDPNAIYKFSVRLNGIDTPELRGGSAKEKAAGLVSRDKLAAKIMGKDVELRNVGFEKYGRVLCEVWLGKLN
jgi:endonuclease YncB( thermonuclease family)